MHQAGRILLLLDPSYATMGLTALAVAGVSASLLMLRERLAVIRSR
jgi:hypothetical protein